MGKGRVRSQLAGDGGNRASEADKRQDRQPPRAGGRIRGYGDTLLNPRTRENPSADNVPRNSEIENANAQKMRVNRGLNKVLR